MRFFFVTLPRWVMGILMLAGVAIGFSNVVGRYLFGHALYWAEEVMVFLIIWGVFLGVAAAAYERAHLNMDLFSSSFSGRAVTALNALLVAVLVACCIFMVVQSWHVVTLFYASDARSVSAGVPKWISHLALPVGFTLMAAAVLVRIRFYLTGRD